MRGWRTVGTGLILGVFSVDLVPGMEGYASGTLGRVEGGRGPHVEWGDGGSDWSRWSTIHLYTGRPGVEGGCGGPKEAGGRVI